VTPLFQPNRFFARCQKGALATWGLLLLVVSGAAPVLAAEPFDQGILWRIEAPNGATSHLLGTMHSSDPTVVALPPPVRQAFEEADSLTLEMIMTEAVKQRIGRSMLLADGRSLDAIIGAERFAQVAAIGAGYGWPRTLVRLMKPWAVMTVFGMPAEELRRQAAGALPLDQQLQADAEARGLTVHGLETPEEQLGVFDGMAEAQQLTFLEMVVEQHPEVDAWFDQLKQLYLARDTGGMLDMMRAQSAGSDPALMASFEDRLVVRRNRLMAQRMAPRLTEGNAFVAVGSLHLPGEAGILSLLERQGYQVSRVY
jgi:uncharacterized protein YbaP (TraB family)